MSQENLLTWIADFIGEYPKIEQQLVDHILDCDGSIDQEELEDAIDDFKNNH